MRTYLFAFLAAVSLQANAEPNFTKDIAGGSDHPLVHRYEGSMLYMYGGENLGQARIVDIDAGKPALHKVEGKVANRFYWGPKGRSALEVFRNYQQALTGAGFKILYSCETDQCEKAKVQNLVQELPREANWKSFDPHVSSIFNSANQPRFHWVTAARPGPGGNTYVTVGLSDHSDYQRVRQFVQIIEPAVLEGGKVTVDTRAIQEGLQRDGKIALYGVTFDTNQAVIREQSAEQLAQMAKALQSQPKMKVFIVGHTDDQGEFEANLALSQKRAQAVAEALAGKYGIPANRMTARGVANLAPVANNASDEGRAKNRRVELVVR
ncbi:OmpA family protein [Pseudoduganella violaceinigra]|uniref:OmpA family protein n=1 Tax=Pseudoduganella violaceinigra TaxID=246602 RepID=UPI000409F5FB|nr:OmpA family protein [Pseudoduganella violaceinigra]